MIFGIVQIIITFWRLETYVTTSLMEAMGTLFYNVNHSLSSTQMNLLVKEHFGGMTGFI